jgi:AAA-like domain
MEEISLQLVLDFVNQTVFEKTGKYLRDLEIIVFKESYAGLTYKEMAVKYGYSMEFLNNDVGYNLWKKLSTSLEEEVGKKSFKNIIQGKLKNSENPTVLFHNAISQSYPLGGIPFPEGSEPLDSPFYIERDGVENLCIQTILKPGSLIRIKAPRLFGKTSLITQGINHASIQNYKKVRLDFDGVNREILENTEKLLRWICFMICRQLNIDNHIDEYWNLDLLGNNDNCTCYFEDYLMPTIDSPLVLVLDDVDRVFPYSEVIEDFFGMLRSWHEKGKTSTLWQQVRLIISHSTESYIPLDLNQSQFNAGVPIELRDFSSSQVLTLAHLHGLQWNSSHAEQLMNMVGGHPYLVRLALYQISLGTVSLERFLTEVVDEGGIYSALLRRYLQTLAHDPDLAAAYKKVVTSTQSVVLDSQQVFRLHSLGLVQFHNNGIMPRCNLYTQYFARAL